jgi:DNA-binding MarR family transcriptional regulator
MGTGGVREEIKQTKPFASATDEGVVTLLRTADRVRTELAAVIEPHGITLQQYNVLRILRGAGDAGLPTLEIAARMIEHNPGITRLLDRLEAKKLVRRVRCPEDRRQVLCHATGAAGRTLAAIEGPLADASRRVLAPLDGARLDDLIRLLDAVRKSAAAPAAAPSQNRRKKEKTSP